MKARHSLLLAALAASMLASSHAHAIDLSNVLVDYTLTSWSQKDGLPTSTVWAIAQDREGYLWLGTDAGPIRFDGARFVAWDAIGGMALPNAPVRALFASRDGSVWFGFGDRGGVSRLRNGEIRNWGARDGIAEGLVTGLLEDPDGTMWVGTSNGLFHFTGSRWERSSAGLPQGQIYSLRIDRAQRLLVGTVSGLFVRVPDQETFERVNDVDDIVRAVAENGDGAIWITDPIVGFRRVDTGDAASESREKGRGARLLYDSMQNLWVGTQGQGLWRVRFDRGERPMVERTTALTGFSDDGVTALLEDSEGNIWAATLDGLNRLTPHKITPITNLGLVGGVEISPNGSVWVGTVDAVIEFSNGTAASRRAPQTLPDPLAAMHADGRGTLWVATGRELLRFEQGRRSSVRLPGPHPPQRITAIASDARGGLWIADLDRGLLRWANGLLAPVTLPPPLKGARLMTMDRDDDGRLWLAFGSGQVAVVDRDGAMRVYGRENGLVAGVYRVVYADRDGVVWLGGTEGLTRFSAGHFATLRAASAFPVESLTGIVADDAGYLWLGSQGSGIVRIARSEFEKAIVDPGYRVHYRVFDKWDGFAGTPRWFGNRGAVRTPDGHLWFVAGRGVTIIDPRALPEVIPQQVPIRIERAVADDRAVPIKGDFVLPARTSRLQIDYTVLNLTSPLKAHFRYRLDGFDAEWIDAGMRRQAFYTNLPPRAYKFRVSVSNDDGTWTESGTTWAFAIQPMFYQTTWFLIASAVALAVVVGAAWRLHVHRVRNQFSALLGERARLSREIHDTLLQGLFGVALRCDAIAAGVESSEPWLQDEFARMRKDVQDYIREARQSIKDLRSPWLIGRDLPSALREAGERATAGSTLAFELTIRGTPRPCAPDVEQQLLRIGQEAIVNVVRHAAARRVEAELRYDDGRVALRIADDGRGFDPDSMRETDGHFGLTSMKERAESVGGTLTILAAQGRGAAVEANLPVGHTS